MKFSLKRVAIISLVCFGVVACGSDNDDSGGADPQTTIEDTDLSDPLNGDNTTGTSGPAPGVTPTDPVSAFDGIWVSNCAQDFSQELSALGIGEFARITLEVVNEVYTRTINSYTDTDCSVASVPSTAISQHSMQFPEGEATTTQGSAPFVDITLEQIEVDGIDASALQATVGYDTEYNIYVVGVDGRLYFGVPASSAATRPTALNNNFYFELQ